ncbi:rhodanese-like domain-containing protein [Alisedimentitalea sp. MJ-SS2]|uniref:rhodanese-like domain-containing protein n=1 Tax=Aliisedimentitalea sp. MJ-SS2 TaxID=3049795 RepID=UPI002910BC43|nr:rhodanese-like domain-containing protein [Alisedimentitalea sp. MJ-SS2]MDU8928990.1 rhodanese-like domain-containing protein [Alisedimentitalea sp. MJ-SS2]
MPILPSSLTRRGFLLSGAALVFATALPQASFAQAAPTSVMDADEAYAKAKAGEIILIDIRTPPEWAQTGIPEGAIALDMTQQEHFINSIVALRKADMAKPMAMICRTGNRTGQLIKILAAQGFPGLVDVTEGIAGGPRGQGWLPRGLPVYPGNADAIAARLVQVMPEG